MLVIHRRRLKPPNSRSSPAAPSTACSTNLRPQFEKASGHKLSIHFDSTPNIITRITSGTPFDCDRRTGRRFQGCGRQGPSRDAPTIDIARVGYGVIVRAGAPKPDISTPERAEKDPARRQIRSLSCRRARRAAYITKVFEQLGIAEEMKAKTRRRPVPAQIAPAVAQRRGRARRVPDQRADRAGRRARRSASRPNCSRSWCSLPPIAADTREADAARAFIDYLKTPPAARCHQSRRHDPRRTPHLVSIPWPPHRLATYSVDGIDQIRRRHRRRHRRSLGALRQRLSDAARSHRSRRADEARRGRRAATRRIMRSMQSPGCRRSRSRKRSSASASTIPTATPNTRTARTRRNIPRMFMRTPRSFVGHNTPLVRPRASRAARL